MVSEPPAWPPRTHRFASSEGVSEIVVFAAQWAFDGVQNDEADPRRRRSERGREDPGILIVAVEHPERVGAGSLEGTSIGEELADLDAPEMQLDTDLHRERC